MSAGISMENFISNFSNLFRPYPPIKCKTHQIWPTFSWKPCFLQYFFYFFKKNNCFSCQRAKNELFVPTHLYIQQSYRVDQKECPTFSESSGISLQIQDDISIKWIIFFGSFCITCTLYNEVSVLATGMSIYNKRHASCHNTGH